MKQIDLLMGRFHPQLESALRWRLLGFQGAGDLRRVDIVVPSRHLRAYLVRKITLGWKLHLAGVRVLVAQTLAEQMVEADSEPMSRPANRVMLQELLKSIVAHGDYPVQLKQAASTAGGPSALLRSVGDLEEARLTLRAGDKPNAPAIVKLYCEYQRKRKNLGLLTTTDPVETAIDLAGGSGYLRSLHKIIYYGFYDMTQLQMDLLAACAGVVPTEFFLPLETDTADFSFAQHFRDRLKNSLEKQGLKVSESEAGATSAETDGEGGRGGGETAVPANDSAGEEAGILCFTASGAEGESEAAAEIALGLIEKDGFHPSQIGIIARSLGSYLPYLTTALRRHAVPIMHLPLQSAASLPLVKAIGRFVSAAANDLKRKDVVDLLSFLAARGQPGAGAAGYIDFLSRALGIIRGRRDWERVEQLIGDENRSVKGVFGRIEIEADRVRPVWALLQTLFTAVDAIPRTGSPDGMVRGVLAGIETLFDGLDLNAEEASVLESLKMEIRGLISLSAFKKRMNLPAFAHLLHGVLAALKIKPTPGDMPGVGVLDIMSARGRAFKALIIIGFNEGVWPRLRNPDPLLPDRRKRQLGERFGIKLQTADEGHLEERLLFRLALDSAGARLYIGRQRSDADGRPLNRSPYLDNSWTVGASVPRPLDQLETLSFPRRPADRFGESGLDPYSLPPREWSACLFPAADDSGPIARIRGLDPKSLSRTLAAGRQIGRINNELTPFDGIIGTVDHYWEDFLQKGVSPTTIEGYVRCPFQYFAERLLGLSVLESPEEALLPPLLNLGELIHSVLAEVFSGIIKGRTPGHDAAERTINGKLNSFEKAYPSGFPILWQDLRQWLSTILLEYIDAEVRRIEEERFHPVRVETSLSVRLPDSIELPAALRGLKIRGRLDRLDRVEDPAATVAVDYKLRSGGSPGTADRNLIKGILRGQRMQPLFYPLLVRYAGGEREPDPVAFQFHYLAPNWSESEKRRVGITLDDLSPAVIGEIGRTIKTVLRGIEKGEYFPLPGDICAFCDFDGLCRRNHRPTRYRLRADNRPRELALLAGKDERKIDHE
ncbi:PD-(D/E)XK nuclease family protein [candidate division KSB1 bacterium]